MSPPSLHPVSRVLVPLLLVMLGLVVVPAPTHAAVSTLCTGYKACAQAGMSHDGYAKAGSRMYWRMYAGHNCTNYVAYRMVRSGMPDVRPWSGGGNATYWGSHMSSITDQTPAVGSVAWWKAGVYPAGSSGHVAYVEKVVSADEIIVSQDSWGGDFSWARVTRGSRGWPTGFIHFNDVPLVNVEKPALVGTAKVGSVLTASPGTWNPGDVDLEYRWLVDGERLAGESSPTLTLDESLLDRRVKVRVIATKLGHPRARSTSAATPAVLPGTLSSTAPPVLSGDSTVEQTLSVTPGTWYPTPDAVGYRWTADGKPVAGADQPTLRLTPELVGRRVTVDVTAVREGYEPVTHTPAAREVAPGRLSLVRDAALDGSARPGDSLRLTIPESSHPAETSVQWLRDGTPVDTAQHKTYPLTEVDLGSRISAVVTLERAGFTPVTRTVVSDRVRSPADVTLRAERAGRRGRKVHVQVHVAATGVDPVAGAVRVKRLGTVTTKDLRHGSARMTLRKVPTRGFRIKVVHPATATTERAVEVVRLRRH